MFYVIYIEKGSNGVYAAYGQHQNSRRKVRPNRKELQKNSFVLMYVFLK